MSARRTGGAAARRSSAPRARAAPPAGGRGRLIAFLGGLACGALAMWVVYNPRVLPGPVQEVVTGADGGAGAAEERRRPRFEFYTMLPEMEVAVPEEHLEASPVAAAASPEEPVGPAPAKGGASYMVQVGSFRRAADAETLKAQLALLGLEARVQIVSVDGKKTWHRVRLGPYRDLGNLKAVRDRLRSEGREYIVLKVRG